MSQLVTELQEALRKAGVDEELSKEAAQAVMSTAASTELATKSDLFALRAEIAELKVELIKWNVGAMALLTAIFAAIVRLG